MMKVNRLIFLFVALSLSAAHAQQTSASSILFNENRSFAASRNWAIRQNNSHEGDFQIGTGNSNTSGLPDFYLSPELAKLTISNSGYVA